MSSYSPSRTFTGGRGEHILRMLSGQQRENEGSFHEQCQGVMSGRVCRIRLIFVGTKSLRPDWQVSVRANCFKNSTSQT